MKRFSVRDLVLTGAFAAILAVAAQIAIPLPAGVPLTLQTFAVALCGFLRGRFRAPLTVGIYLLLGAVGLPVFSSFRGGVQTLLGPTGGFLFGFLPMAFLCGLGASDAARVLFALGGLCLCHAIGCAQYALVTGAPLFSAFLTVSLPFFLKDTVSLALAYLPARRLRAARVTC